MRIVRTLCLLLLQHKRNILRCHMAGSQALDFWPILRTQISDPLRREQHIAVVVTRTGQEGMMGRGILLWLLGVPIPVIILLALLWH